MFITSFFIKPVYFKISKNMLSGKLINVQTNLDSAFCCLTDLYNLKFYFIIGIVSRTMADSTERILSIQSHVVSGYVGNKSATFPLQLLGFETDCINSVQFSNHTGYDKGVKGQRLNDVELWDLIDGLEANGLDNYSHIINGYIGKDTFLRKLAQVIKKLKGRNPNLMYVCDPVMGDSEPVGWYVPKELLPIYRDEILPLCDICVPNQFEVEMLSGCQITDEKSAFNAIEKLHDMGVKVVVLSSTDSNVNPDESKLKCLASRRVVKPIATVGNETSSDSKLEYERYKIEFPKLPLPFVGSGDLFTALLTAWLTRSGNNDWPYNMNIPLALEKTIGTMQAVLNRTLKHYNLSTMSNDSKLQKAAAKELKLIQSRDEILNPKTIYHAERVIF